MHRLLRLVPLVAGLAAPACLIRNPGFDGRDTDSTGTTAASSDTSSGTSTSSGDAPTTTSSERSSTDAPTMSTGDDTTDATTAAEPVTAELRHYPDLAQCDFPFWCVNGGQVDQPSTAENWNVECFDAPFAPPFVVDRVGFAVYGSKGGPSARLEFHAYDADAERPVDDPFHTIDLGVIDVDGHRDFPLDPPVPIDVQRFCIGVHSGEEFGPQLGLALDDVPAPVGQSFVGIDGPNGCDVDRYTDLSTIDGSSRTQWCIDATITMSP